MKKLQETDVQGKHVVVRVDFDDPLATNGELISDFRIRASLPTITYLREHGAKQIVLVSKLGRPVVRPRERVANIIAGNPRLTMEPIARHVRTLLGKPIEKISTRQVEDFPLPAYILDRNLYLLENIRFDWREGRNDPDFAKDLASLGDLYVFEAFAMLGSGEEASTVGVAAHTNFVAGLRLQREVEELEKLRAEIAHPNVLILGGAKTERKIPVIEELLDGVDLILLGGVIANTFAKAAGIDVKQSVVDDGQLDLARELLERAPEKFRIPTDFTWMGGRIMDIGEETRRQYQATIAEAKTIFWNGTMGVTSTTAQDFKFGSLDVARAMANNKAATTIVSGGDTVGLLQEQDVDFDAFTFVSTGGGATLKFLAGERLPALEALRASSSS